MRRTLILVQLFLIVGLASLVYGHGFVRPTLFYTPTWVGNINYLGLKPSNDGGYYACYWFFNQQGGQFDGYYVTKVDGSGLIQWSRRVNSASAMAISPSNDCVIASGNTLTIFHSTGDSVQRVIPGSFTITQMSYFSDGKLLCAGDTTPPGGNYPRLWVINSSLAIIRSHSPTLTVQGSSYGGSISAISTIGSDYAVAMYYPYYIGYPNQYCSFIRWNSSGTEIMNLPHAFTNSANYNIAKIYPDGTHIYLRDNIFYYEDAAGTAISSVSNVFSAHTSGIMERSLVRLADGNFASYLGKYTPNGTLLGTVSNNSYQSYTTLMLCPTSDSSLLFAADWNLCKTNQSFQLPTFELLRPNGGETFQVGMVDTIRWNSQYVDGNVMVEVKRSYPSGVWETIANNVPNTGSYNWSVSGNASSVARFRISTVQSATLRDTSAAAVTIVRPTISLLTPLVADTLRIGDYYNFQWSASNTTGSFRIDLNRFYPGDAWETIGTNLSNTGEWLWQVTGPASTTARFRIMNLTNSSIGDTSDFNTNISGTVSGLYVYASTSSLNFSSIVEPTARDSLQITIRVAGSQPLVLGRMVTLSGPYRCSPLNLPQVAPGQTTTITVYFEPTSQGTFSGTIALVSNALNYDTLRISCSGTAAYVPAVPRNLSISIQSWNAALSWQRVDSSLSGVPIPTSGYIIYYADNSTGPWLFHGYTTGAASVTYTHSGVAHFSSNMYYRVRAYVGSSTDELLQRLPVGTPEREVQERISKHLGLQFTTKH